MDETLCHTQCENLNVGPTTYVKAEHDSVCLQSQNYCAEMRPETGDSLQALGSAIPAHRGKAKESLAQTR